MTLDVRHADLLHGAGRAIRRAGPPTVVANLLRPLLAHIARTGFAREIPQILIVSGLLRAEADAIVAASPASRACASRPAGELGEWAALTLVAADPTAALAP